MFPIYSYLVSPCPSSVLSTPAETCRHLQPRAAAASTSACGACMPQPDCLQAALKRLCLLRHGCEEAAPKPHAQASKPVLSGRHMHEQLLSGIRCIALHLLVRSILRSRSIGSTPGLACGDVGVWFWVSGFLCLRLVCERRRVHHAVQRWPSGNAIGFVCVVVAAEAVVSAGVSSWWWCVCGRLRWGLCPFTVAFVFVTRPSLY